MHSTNPTRRSFVKAALAASAAPLILPGRVFGQTAPSNRISVGMIGTGRQMHHVNLPQFLENEHAIVRAVCDVDRWRVENAKSAVDRHYGNRDCDAHHDWREIIARDDIDAVMISTPDHWHVPMALAAVQAGKHVSCEKPLTMSIAEGRLLADAAKEAGVTFRTDTECRSEPMMHRAAELVLNGRIGKLTRIEVTLPTMDEPGGNPRPMPVPADLNYDLWLGPAPEAPYTVDRVHPPRSWGRPGWMRWRGTSEGVITNWGTHLLDVAQLANGTERTGPVEVEASGVYPEPGSGLWDVLYTFEARYRYADGLSMDYRTAEAPVIRFEGEDGWIQCVWLRRGGLEPGITAHDESLLASEIGEDEIRLPRREDKEDFIHGIRTGEPTMADAEIGHRTCSVGQIAHIAVQRGRKLAWDPDAERFTNDEEANALLARPMRGDWM